MTERIYGERPDLYDAFQADWDYERDVAFLLAALERHDVDAERVLEVGCGTGEHTRRLAAEGFDVTAVDPSGAMLDAARAKVSEERADCNAGAASDSRVDATAGDPMDGIGDGDEAGTVEFVESGLPALGVDGEYDLVVAVRGVVNHLPPADLDAALDALADRVADGGLVVFDNSPLPADGNTAALDVGEAPGGQYARIAQMTADGDRLSWDQVVVAPDGEVFVSSRPMTPFPDLAVAAACSRAGLSVHARDGYGEGDERRTVFVCVG